MPTGVASATPCLALDIGGTKAEAAVVTRDGVVVRRERLDVRSAGAQLFKEISEMFERMCADRQLPAFGIAWASPMLASADRVSPLNIPVGRDFALREQFEMAALGDSRTLEVRRSSLGSAAPTLGAVCVAWRSDS